MNGMVTLRDISTHTEIVKYLAEYTGNMDKGKIKLDKPIKNLTIEDLNDEAMYKKIVGIREERPIYLTNLEAIMKRAEAEGFDIFSG